MRLLFCFLCLPFGLQAQKIDQSAHFQELLLACQLEFLAPLDAGYKDVSVLRNSVQNYDFAIRSRKEKLEIRYLLEPYQENNPGFETPHIRSIQKLMHLASNEQDFVMTGLDVDPELLKEHFNADWGKIFFFRPKLRFCNYQHVKMLSLFKEGQGMAYIFFLFNEPTRDLNNRMYTIRFRD